MSAPDRRGKRGWILPLAAGIAVALVAGVALTITHHQAKQVVPPHAAIQAALRDRPTEQVLAGSRWDRVTVNSLDDQSEHVTFFAGGRMIESVSVDRRLIVSPSADGRTMKVPYGNWIAFEPAMLASLAALFVLMAGVVPWRRARNLDVAACLSFVAPVVLLQHEYLDASVVSALPGIVYLLVRCGLKALGPAREPAPQRPLLAALTPRLDPVRRIRSLRVLLAVLALVFLMVGVGSPIPVDVIYATMQGATRLIHGVLPYGHMPPGVSHGDTYPILTYALYTPLALFEPVNASWGASVDLGLAAAVLAALAAAWALFRVLAGGRTRVARSPEAEEAGLRAATAWLCFPPLLITVSTGTTDVALAAMLAAALMLWRRPAACSGVLAVAGWFKLAPFALLPVSLAPLRGRRLANALATVVGVSVPPVVLLLALGGLHGPSQMLHGMSFQFSRGSLQSAWSVFGLETLQPGAQACVLGLIAAAAITLWRRPGLARDRARMAALMATILIGLQLVADYWAFLYLVWFVPLVGSSLLADTVPAAEPARAAVPARAAEAVPALAG